MNPLLPKVLFQTNEHRVPQHIERAVQDRAPGWDYHFYTHENIIDYFAALQEDDPDCKPLHDAICEAHDIVRAAAAARPRAISAREHSPPNACVVNAMPAAAKVSVQVCANAEVAARPASRNTGPRKPRPAISAPNTLVASGPCVYRSGQAKT